MGVVTKWRENLPVAERPRWYRSHDTPRDIVLRQHGRNPGPWDVRYDRLPPCQRRVVTRVRFTIRAYPVWALDGTCGVSTREGRRVCDRPAGWKTDHEGEGACRRHDEMASRRSEVAWLMAHRFAQELNCSPWEGLLRAVRIAAGKVEYTQWVLGQARHDFQLEGRTARELKESRELTGEDGKLTKELVGTGIFVHPDTGEPLGADDARARDLAWWVEKNEYWVERLARYSKAAVDAGVAERLVAQVEAEAQALARPLNAVLGALDAVEGLSEPLRESIAAELRRVAREELLALERETTGGEKVIEGEVRR